MVGPRGLATVVLAVCAVLAAVLAAGPRITVLAGDAPATVTPTRELYDRLRDATADADNGIAIDDHVTADGRRHLIVYLGGATFDPDNQFVTRNIPAYRGALNDGHITSITEVLDGDRDCRIMLVGFSQGGMDAQNIAAEATFRDQVTTVVTFASPIVQPPGEHDVVHLWDAGDLIPRLPLPRPTAQVFQSASSNDSALVYNMIPPFTRALGPVIYVVQRLALHGQRSTYQQVSHAFDSAPGFAAVKADIGAYLRRQPVD